MEKRNFFALPPNMEWCATNLNESKRKKSMETNVKHKKEHLKPCFSAYIEENSLTGLRDY